MVEVEYADLLSPGQKRKRAPSGIRSFSGVTGVTVGLFSGLISASISACSFEEGSPPPPEALLGFFDATEVQTVSSGPGLTYYGLRNVTEPWAVHMLRVDLGQCDLGFEVLEAPVAEGSDSGRNLVTELLTFAGEAVLAGVNGDFFTPEGLPLGTEVVGGEIRRIRDRPAFAWHPKGDPWMGTPREEGDSILVLGWEVSRFRSDGETEVIGGFPLLLRDGRRVGDLGLSERPSFAADRHPRTAVGFDRDEDLLWVVVVDGRQTDYSAGMSLPELASLFEALEVEEAINLDGGGSSVMVLEGTMLSRPSDPEGERPVANALGIRRDSTFCRPRL